MKNLITNIQETIREVYTENDYLSDIDLAYIFLLGVKRNTLRDLKEDFKKSVKEGMFSRLKSIKVKVPKYKNRQITDSLFNKLTLKTIELLDQMILHSDDDTKFCEAKFLDGYPLIEAGDYKFSEVLGSDLKGKQPIISGKIQEVIVRTSGKKNFAYLIVSDYKGIEITVLVSSYFYPQYEDDLKNCIGKYVGLTGEIAYDNYRKTKIIKAYELDIVKGYHISRVPI